MYMYSLPCKIISLLLFIKWLSLKFVNDMSKRIDMKTNIKAHHNLKLVRLADYLSRSKLCILIIHQ